MNPTEPNAPPTDRIRAAGVFINLANVLCRYAPDERVVALAQAAALPAAQAEARIWGSGFAAACDRGEVPLAAMLAGLRERLDADLTEAHLTGLWALAYEPAGAVLEACGRGAAGMVADASPLLRAGLGAYLPEVDRAVGARAYSCEHRRLAAEPALYRAIAEGLGPGAAPVLVDRDSAHLAAAASAGWRCERYVSPDGLRRVLEGRLAPAGSAGRSSRRWL